MKKYFMSFVLGFSFNLWAANGAGNGGGSHVCGDEAEVYDLYEGQARYGIETLTLNQSEDEIFEYALKKVGGVFPKLQGLIESELRAVEEKISVRNIVLERTLDADNLFHAPGCEFMQAANWDTQLGKILVSQFVWERMNEFQRAVLKFHEAAYSVQRNVDATKNTQLIRKFVAEVFSHQELETQIVGFEHLYGDQLDLDSKVVVDAKTGKFSVKLRTEAYHTIEVKETYEGTCYRDDYQGMSYVCRSDFFNSDPVCRDEPQYDTVSYSCAKVRTVKKKVSEGSIEGLVDIEIVDSHLIKERENLRFYLKNKELEMEHIEDQNIDIGFTVVSMELKRTGLKPQKLSGRVILRAYNIKKAIEMRNKAPKPLAFTDDYVDIEASDDLSEFPFFIRVNAFSGKFQFIETKPFPMDTFETRVVKGKTIVRIHFNKMPREQFLDTSRFDMKGQDIEFQVSWGLNGIASQQHADLIDHSGDQRTVFIFKVKKEGQKKLKKLYIAGKKVNRRDYDL